MLCSPTHTHTYTNRENTHSETQTKANNNMTLEKIAWLFLPSKHQAECVKTNFPKNSSQTKNLFWNSTKILFVFAPKENNAKLLYIFFASYETNHKNVKLWCIIIIIMIINYYYYYYYYYYSYIEIYQLSYESVICLVKNP